MPSRSNQEFEVFLVNPAPPAERIEFSFITPRALPVVAAVTPQNGYVKGVTTVDQAIHEFNPDRIRPGDLVGLSVHTFNISHGYRLAEEAKKRGATVVFGGPHASIFPEETLQYGDAVVTGDAELVWGQLIDDYAAGKLQQCYRGGRVPGDAFTPARWDLMDLDRYLVASVQTVRGCPKQCSFCSVWVQDGRAPRLRTNDAIIEELKQLYKAGFRLVMFADDNFYPYTREDIANARSAGKKLELEAGMEQRFDLLERLATEIPSDMRFCTQITMEVADDPEYLAAMKRAHVTGALIGIETVTQAGLEATRKTFNSTGDELVRKLEKIRKEGFPFIMGAFIFGIESDTPESLDYTIEFARDCGITLAQFIPMTPLPGTVDFQMMRRGRANMKLKDPTHDYWLDSNPPRIMYHHPHFSDQELSKKVEKAWRTFYGLRSVVKRSKQLGFTDPRGFLAYLAVSRGLLARYKRYGISADSAARGTKKRVANLLGRLALRTMKRPRMDTLPAVN